MCSVHVQEFLIASPPFLRSLTSPRFRVDLLRCEPFWRPSRKCGALVCKERLAFPKRTDGIAFLPDLGLVGERVLTKPQCSAPPVDIYIYMDWEREGAQTLPRSLNMYRDAAVDLAGRPFRLASVHTRSDVCAIERYFTALLNDLARSEASAEGAHYYCRASFRADPPPTV